MKPFKRGMRDIPTHHGVNDRSVPASRAQIVTELARLEHELARVERTLAMLHANLRQAEARREQVVERLHLMRVALYPPEQQPDAPPVSRRQNEPPMTGFTNVDLEY
jgi:septal ring factor EnvC (AmiA/AmiB activator)